MMDIGQVDNTNLLELISINNLILERLNQLSAMFMLFLAISITIFIVLLLYKVLKIFI